MFPISSYTTPERLGSSFRDPSGFVYSCGNTIYRSVARTYKPHYDFLVDSGLYDQLTAKGLLIKHSEEVPGPGDYKILKPEPIQFISYPYEWSFGQLKHAALATLQAMQTAFLHGMILKDASAYNIQFHRGRPVLIDTLSFEIYEEGKPWMAYRQFCEHFLAPLAIISIVDVRLSMLQESFIDGVPLDLACSILPKSAFLNANLLTHLFLHSKMQHRCEGTSIKHVTATTSKTAVIALIDNLMECVNSLRLRDQHSQWSSYYSNNNYSTADMNSKEVLVRDLLRQAGGNTVWDIGANTGRFSAIAAELGMFVISMDMDPSCVERNYQNCVQQGQEAILPLCIDLRAPSPNIGWNNAERNSLAKRGPADTLLALALIHHLAIGNNVPFTLIAKFMAGLCKNLIIEFVPKSDSQVQRLLSGREDVFPHYQEDDFVEEFSKYFRLIERRQLPDSERVLYLWQTKGSSV